MSRHVRRQPPSVGSVEQLRADAGHQVIGLYRFYRHVDQERLPWALGRVLDFGTFRKQS